MKSGNRHCVHWCNTWVLLSDQNFVDAVQKRKKKTTTTKAQKALFQTAQRWTNPMQRRRERRVEGRDTDSSLQPPKNLLAWPLLSRRSPFTSISEEFLPRALKEGKRNFWPPSSFVCLRVAGVVQRHAGNKCYIYVPLLILTMNLNFTRNRSSIEKFGGK